MSSEEAERHTEEEGEVVDGLPVVAEPRVVEAPVAARSAVPAVHAAALAATGFAVGVTTAAVVTRHRAKRTTRAVGKRKRKAGAFGEIVSSNSFLVDVHLLRRD